MSAEERSRGVWAPSHSCRRRPTSGTAPLRLALLIAAGAAMALAPARLAAQDVTCNNAPGELEVMDVDFHGNRSFRAADLENAIVTTPSSWFHRTLHLPVGPRRCLDSLELERDVLRLRLYYRQRGYYHTDVTSAVDSVGASKVAVSFRIDEGEPVVIQSISVAGLDSVKNGPALERRLLALRGRPYSKSKLESVTDTILDRLRNSGYARAEQPLKSDSVDIVNNRAFVSRAFITGPVMRVGRIEFDIRPDVPGDSIAIPVPVVRKLLSVKKGAVYRQQDLLDSQRDLYQTEAYRLVEVALAPDSLQPQGDSLLVVTRLVEAPMRSMRLGVGYGTLDCFRTQGRFVDRNFLGGAQRLEINARVSKIGIGEPLDGAQALCQSIQRDPFSQFLNYYAGVTFQPTTLFGPRNVASLTLFSERRSEFQAYLRETPFGANASLTRSLGFRLPLTLSYQVEFGRTTAENAVFCSLFNQCDLDQIARLKAGSSLHTLSAAIARDRTDNPVEPRNGTLSRLELRHGITSISGQTRQYNKAFLEGTIYRPLSRSTVFAARLQLGGVLAQNLVSGASDFVPPQERLYAGGPNSVRGYNQNELGPVVYVVTDTSHFERLAPGQAIDRPDLPRLSDGRVRADTNTTGDTLFLAVPGLAPTRIDRFSPTGGNALLVGNLEVRTRSPLFPERVQLSAFLDFGQVWTRQDEFVSLGDVRFTPGMGARVGTPVGLVGVDVGYRSSTSQVGPVYFVGKLNAPDSTGALVPTLALRCLSPGNLLPTGHLEGTGASCPSSFQEARGTSFFSRLTFHISIGQAF